ncbi:putative esterase [Sporotomaculum syntrophicum]|uniref:Esterase n=1 Tax=Sporotomaculum syntrophicum TaxID=182264 RepID=A0A9D2WQ96_9FIRM|nr:PaaI family thioesterase [Sporotomaculum syntrophicum]KAF1085113.1 putative esterase [Sporotomaculum syntrophicum]
MKREITLETINKPGLNCLADMLGLEILQIDEKKLKSRMKVTLQHLAPNGYLHAATIIALADTTCGWGTYINLPETAGGFATIELKSNFLGTCLEGTIYCEAVAEHIGKTTQVWDATVTNEAGKKIALFRCTQMITY